MQRVTEIVLFHHALGQTPGVLQFAETLRAAGHTVHTPDVYEGRTFTDLDEGVGYAQETGFGAVLARATSAVSALPQEVVYAGFSLGSMHAQALTQTRPGALGTLLLYGGDIPVSEFDAPWPSGVPLQIHAAEEDPWLEMDVVRSVAAEVEGSELFVYPGSGHLFAEPGHAHYDAESARLLEERVLAFLSRID